MECQQATACLPPTRCPDVAVLDLDSLGRTSDAVHQKIRNACPQTPIIVVCSKDDALEARRWKRTATWFVPKAVGADGILRLLEELQPKVVTARRKRSESRFRSLFRPTLKNHRRPGMKWGARLL